MNLRKEPSGKAELEEVLVVGARVRLGEQYCQRFKGSTPGEILTLVEGEFEEENGLYSYTSAAPSVWDEQRKEFDSIYHLFGNDLEDFLDCEVLPSAPPILQILKAACVEEVQAYKLLHCYITSDAAGVRYGALTFRIARIAGRPTASVRRELLKLERQGLVMREPPHARGTTHRWWPVDFYEEIKGQLARSEVPA